MDTSARRTAFGMAVAVALLIAVAVFQLPEAFVTQFERNRAFDATQAGWAYRLLVLVALVQAAYVGYSILRPEKVAAARATDPRLADADNRRLFTMTARTAAFIPLLTIAIGLVALWATGERGGFWLFLAIAIVQWAWYYRQVGEIGRFLGFQPEPPPKPSPSAWTREPPDYCPPLARGLRPLDR